MLQKVWLKEQRERKNKSKVTQELVERKVKMKKKTKTYKQEKKRVTQMKKKKGKQQGERMWETEKNKMIENGMFSRYVKEGQKVTKVYLNIPYLTLSLRYKLKKSPIVILRVVQRT